MSLIQHQLNNHEETLAKMGEIPPVSTVSIFHPNAGTTDSSQAVAQLRSRLSSVARANPWVCGYIQKCPKTSKYNICFHETVTDSDVDKIFHHAVVDDDMKWASMGGENFKNVKYHDDIQLLVDVTSKFIVKSGHKKDFENVKQCHLLPLMRYTVITNTHNTKLAVVLSVSHYVADGSCFYKLLHMIHNVEDIVSLNPKRLTFIPKRLTRFSSLTINNAFRISLVLVSSLIALIVKYIWGLKLNKQTMYAVVSKEHVKSKKEQYGSSDEGFWVSSNDIIVSDMANVLDVGCADVVVDMRNRLPGCETNLAGNYLDFIFLSRNLFETPANVRQHLRRGLESWKPSFDMISGYFKGFLCTTNWASLSKELIVDGYSEAFHYPLVNVPDYLASRFYMGYFTVIFRCYKDYSSVQVTSAGEAIPKKLKQAGLFYN